MKSIQLSVLVMATCTSLLFAGGELGNITPYKIQDMKMTEEVKVIPIEIPVEAPIVATPAIIPPAEVSSIYVGLGLVAARYDTQCMNNSSCNTSQQAVDKTGGIVARAGYDFNKYMGIEARGMITSVKANGGKIKHLGVFAKPMYPVNDEINVYGLGGIAKTTTHGDLRKTDVTGLAFGAGVEYDLSDDKKKDAKYDREFDGQGDQEKGLGVFADYERLYYKSGSPDLDAVSVGLTYDF